MNEKKQDLPEKIKAVISDSHFRSFDPKDSEDYQKINRLQTRAFEILRENDKPIGAIRGLYIEGSQLGGLSVRADHDPGIELPIELKNMLDNVEVELVY